MVVILTVSLKQVLLHKNIVFGTIYLFQKCSHFRFLSVAMIKPSKRKLKAVIPACMMFSVYFSESLRRLLSVLCLISSSEKEKETGKKRIGNKRVE